MSDILDQAKEDESAEKPLNKSAYDMIVSRTGKVTSPEIYTSKTEFVIIFPTEYSVIVKDRGSRKHAKVEVYYKAGDITQEFFPGRTSKKVKRQNVSALFDRLSSEEAVALITKEIINA